MELDTLPENTSTSIGADIQDLVNEVRAIENQLYQLDKEVVALKDRRNGLLRRSIPDLLLAAGTNLISTPGGYRVSIRKYNYVRVKDKSALSEYLESRGDDSLIDTTMRIKNISQNIRDSIRDIVLTSGGVVMKMDDSMHHSTQRKYFNELIEKEPQEVDRIKQIGEVSEYYETKIHKE